MIIGLCGKAPSGSPRRCRGSDSAETSSRHSGRGEIRIHADLRAACRPHFGADEKTPSFPDRCRARGREFPELEKPTCETIHLPRRKIKWGLRFAGNRLEYWNVGAERSRTRPGNARLRTRPRTLHSGFTEAGYSGRAVSPLTAADATGWRPYPAPQISSFHRAEGSPRPGHAREDPLPGTCRTP